MNALWNRIEALKRLPYGARKRAALALAGMSTGLIALVWLTASLSTGAFAIKNEAPAPAVAAAPADENPGLAGAAAVLQAKDEPAHIEIVDVSSTTAKAAPEPTVIPF